MDYTFLEPVYENKVLYEVLRSEEVIKLIITSFNSAWEQLLLVLNSTFFRIEEKTFRMQMDPANMKYGL